MRDSLANTVPNSLALKIPQASPERLMKTLRQKFIGFEDELLIRNAKVANIFEHKLVIP